LKLLREITHLTLLDFSVSIKEMKKQLITQQKYMLEAGHGGTPFLSGEKESQEVSHGRGGGALIRYTDHLS
jgi:hypothetical protein